MSKKAAKKDAKRACILEREKHMVIEDFAVGFFSSSSSSSSRALSVLPVYSSLLNVPFLALCFPDFLCMAR